jgi:aspartate 1-decarboxylase
MQRVIMKSKIHRATVTWADIDADARNHVSEQAIA